MLLTDIVMADHVFPSPPPPQTHLLLRPDSELQGVPWYWGAVSRAEVSVLLKDSPNGTFLIRDSSDGKRGSYTLTLRSGGQTVLLRILSSEGLYGFSEPLQFRSIPDLVQFHRTRSLSRYNPALDVRLEQPFCRDAQGSNWVTDQGTTQTQEGKNGVAYVENQLQENIQKLQEKRQEFDRLQSLFQETTQEIQIKQTAIEAFNETIQIFEDQCKSQKQDSNQDFGPDFGPDSGLDWERLRSKLGEIRETRIRLEQELESRIKDLEETEQSLDQLRPDLIQTWRTAQDLLSRSHPNGATYRQLEECGGQSELLLSDLDLDSGPTTWFKSGLSRSEAEELLHGKPSGTFLIRESSRKDCYACSVVVSSEVKHCVIVSSDHGLGFEPSTQFWSLQDLVHFYSKTSLALHNRELDVRLLRPAFKDCLHGIEKCLHSHHISATEEHPNCAEDSHRPMEKLLRQDLTQAEDQAFTESSSEQNEKMKPATKVL